MVPVVVTAFSPRFLRVHFAFLAKRSSLAFSLTFNLLEPLFQTIDLFLLLLNNLQQQLACRAVGIDFWHIHDAQSVVKSHEIHQHQFLSR